MGAESPGALEDKDKHKITDYSEESDLFTVESFVGARNLRKCMCVCVCFCVLFLIILLFLILFLGRISTISQNRTTA